MTNDTGRPTRTERLAPIVLTGQRGQVVRIYRSRDARMRSGILHQVVYCIAGERKVQQYASEAKARAAARLALDRLGAEQAAEDPKHPAAPQAQQGATLEAAMRLCDGVPLLVALKEWRAARDLVGDQIAVACHHFLSQRRGSARQTVLLSDAIEQFLRAKDAAGVDVRKAYQSRLEQFSACLRNYTLEAVQAVDIATYLDQFQNPSTRQTHRKNLVTLFGWCQRQGFLPQHAPSAVANTERVRLRSNQAIEIMRPEAMQKLVAQVKVQQPQLQVALYLAAWHGMRRDELEKQLWEHFDRDRGVAIVSAAKAGTPAFRHVNLEPAFVQLLRAHGPTRGRLCPPGGMRRIRTLAQKADISLPRNGFRKSAISYAIASGVSIQAVAAQMGTSEFQIHRHYRTPVVKAEADAWYAALLPLLNLSIFAG